MSILSTMLHISFGEADQLRRYIEKSKKYPEQYKEFIDTFVEKSVKNGFSEDAAKYTQQMIIDSSGYGFNQSHAYGYTILTMQMAWIKVNYPIAFYTAMITYDTSKFNLYKNEAEQKGIFILGPHVNLSKSEAIISDNCIRIGLSQIKGIGAAAIEIIIKNQPYTSINDFIKRAAHGAVNKKIIEVLINNDCFESLPIIFADDTLTEESPLFGRLPIYLGRGELLKWFEKYVFYKDQKAEKNYFIEKDRLSRNLQEDRTLVFEKDNTLIVPFSKLNDFGVYGSNSDGSFTEEDLKELVSTRKLAKGRLAKPKSQTKLTPILKPFIKDEKDILSSVMSNREMYTTDILNKDGISFRLHPFYRTKNSIAIVSQAKPNTLCHIAGLITEIRNIEYRKKDANGNKTSTTSKAVVVTIVTPHESCSQFFSQKDFEKYKNDFYVGNYIDFKGIKGNNDYISVDKTTIRFHSKIYHKRNDLILKIRSSELNKYSDDTSYLDNLRQEFEEECKKDPDPEINKSI